MDQNQNLNFTIVADDSKFEKTIGRVESTLTSLSSESNKMAGLKLSGLTSQFKVLDRSILATQERVAQLKQDIKTMSSSEAMAAMQGLQNRMQFISRSASSMFNKAMGNSSRGIVNRRQVKDIENNLGPGPGVTSNITAYDRVAEKLSKIAVEAKQATSELRSTQKELANEAKEAAKVEQESAKAAQSISSIAKESSNVKAPAQQASASLASIAKEAQGFSAVQRSTAYGMRQMTYGMSSLFQSGLNNAGTSFSSMGAGITAMIGGIQPELIPILLAIEAIIAGVGILTSVARKATEVVTQLIQTSAKAAMQYAQSAFSEYIKTSSYIYRVSGLLGDSFGKLKGFVQSQGIALGMSIGNAYQYAAQYANLMRNVTTSTKTTTDLTIQMMKATSIVASKTGMDFQTVADKIVSGMRGNTRAIDDLGIYVQVNILKMSRAFKEIAKGRHWEQLNAYEQEQIRILSILEQITRSYGNEVAQTAALKVAQLGAAWDSLKSAAGQFVVQALIPMISALTTIVTFAFNAVQALALLFGMQIELGDSSGFGSAAGDANDLATGLGKAAKNAQKLLSFDEVFTLKDTSGGGGGGGGGGKIGNPKVTPVPEFDFSNSVFKKIADWYATSNLKKIVDDIKEGWTWIQTNILKPAESYSGKALLLFLDDLDKGLGLIHTVWTIIKPDVEKLWEKFLRPIANYMAEKGLKTLRDIGDRLTALSDWCKNNPEKVRLAFIVLTVAFGLLVSPILIVTSSIAGWLSIMGKLVANMKNITKILLDLATGDWKQAWTDYKEALDNFGSAGRLAKDAVQLLGDTMVYVSGILTDLAKGDWKSAWEKLTSFPEHFRDVFNSLPSIPKFIDNMMHPLRTLEDILTRIIDKINKIGGAKITVPDIGTGGGSGGTHAATGAVVLRPTSMVLGDNGGAGELAMPLGNSPQVADFANRVAKAVAGSGQSQSLDVRIVMDGRTVARKVIGPLDKETLARGTPIMVEVV